MEAANPSEFPALGHEALLTLARKVSAAADDADVEHLSRSVRQFADALATHLRSEGATMTTVTPAEERILHRGQSRLRSLTAGLLWDADHECPHRLGYCSSRAEELLALLTIQAHDESRALHRHAA